MTDTPKRPQWNHPEVKAAAAEYVFDDVTAWATGMGILPENHNPKELLAVLTLTLEESVDCYDAARYFDSFCEWPVDSTLIRILDRAYRALPTLVSPLIHQWVLDNQIRFLPKEGEEIKFKVGDAEATGTCVGVVRREARGFVSLRNGDVLPIVAEDVVKVFKAKRPTSPINPNGGTPIAAPKQARA